MNSVIFRTNANPQLGYGHLMRCRVLAKALYTHGAKCYMVGPDEQYKTYEDNEVFKGWRQVPEWTNEELDAEEFIKISEEQKCNIAVLDDYRIREKYQAVLVESDINWLQFDGRADQRFWADWILNASPLALRSSYEGLLQKDGQKLFLGPEYAIIRPQFKNVPGSHQLDKKNPRIFISFGGGDDRGSVIYVLESIYTHIPNAVSIIMCGENNPGNTVIENWINENPQYQVNMHINPEDIPGLMTTCDMAIISGGTITFEVFSCGIPAVILSIADNQVKQSEGWHERGAAVYVGEKGKVKRPDLIEAIQDVIENINKMKINVQALSIAQRGSDYIARELLQAQ